MASMLPNFCFGLLMNKLSLCPVLDTCSNLITSTQAVSLMNIPRKRVNLRHSNQMRDQNNSKD